MQNDDSQGNSQGCSSAIDDMVDNICRYITRELLPPGCGIEVLADDDLLAIGYLDSMQFMRLVQYCEEHFELSIPPEDLLIENFQSVDRLSKYLVGRIGR